MLPGRARLAATLMVATCACTSPLGPSHAGEVWSGNLYPSKNNVYHVKLTEHDGRVEGLVCMINVYLNRLQWRDVPATVQHRVLTFADPYGATYSGRLEDGTITLQSSTGNGYINLSRTGTYCE